VRGCYWAPSGVGIRRAAEERVGPKKEWEGVVGKGG